MGAIAVFFTDIGTKPNESRDFDPLKMADVIIMNGIKTL